MVIVSIKRLIIVLCIIQHLDNHVVYSGALQFKLVDPHIDFGVADSALREGDREVLLQGEALGHQMLHAYRAQLDQRVGRLQQFECLSCGHIEPNDDVLSIGCGINGVETGIILGPFGIGKLVVSFRMCCGKAWRRRKDELSVLHFCLEEFARIVDENIRSFVVNNEQNAIQRVVVEAFIGRRNKLDALQIMKVERLTDSCIECDCLSFDVVSYAESPHHVAQNDEGKDDFCGCFHLRFLLLSSVFNFHFTQAPVG